MDRKLLAVIGFACASLLAQLPDSEHISVTGEATVQAMPDMATIQVQVYGKDMVLAKAKAVVDERSAAIIKLAESRGATGEDITASQIDLTPNIEWQETGFVDKGTSISREVTVVLRDLSRYGEFIQGLTEVPISQLVQVRMDTTRRDELRAAALADAIKSARAEAETVAAQFGARLGPVYSINDGGGERPWEIASNLMRVRQAAPPKESFVPGPISITARVQAVFRLKPGR